MTDCTIEHICLNGKEFLTGVGQRAREAVVTFNVPNHGYETVRYIVVLDGDENEPHVSFFADCDPDMLTDLGSIELAETAFPDVDFGAT